MSIREFRRQPKEYRKAVIDRVEDPLTQRVLTVAFLGFGKKSWVQVAVQIGGGNTADSVRMIAARVIAQL